jgi:predicted RNA-binding protein with TRAM domain
MDREEKPFKKFETPKPVAVGDEVDVTIESVGGQGDGIAKVSGFVVFVKGAKKGEKIRVKITDVKRTYAIGEKVGEAAAQAQKDTSEDEDDDEEEGEEEEPAEEEEEDEEGAE